MLESKGRLWRGGSTDEEVHAEESPDDQIHDKVDAEKPRVAFVLWRGRIFIEVPPMRPSGEAESNVI